jgi:hypothetical protein
MEPTENSIRLYEPFNQNQHFGSSVPKMKKKTKERVQHMISQSLSSRTGILLCQSKVFAESDFLNSGNDPGPEQDLFTLPKLYSNTPTYYFTLHKHVSVALRSLFLLGGCF